MINIKQKKSKQVQNPFVGYLFISFFIIAMISEILDGHESSLTFILSVLIFVFLWTIYNKGKKKSSFLIAKMNDIDLMDGVQFEKFLALLFQLRGYKVLPTKTSGDFGADLILKKSGRCIIVQAKRYSKPVGLKAVQEVNSAIKVYKAHEAWVVTNNEFTKSAITLARVNDVRLIGRKELINLIKQCKSSSSRKENFFKLTLIKYYNFRTKTSNQWLKHKKVKQMLIFLNSVVVFKKKK